MKLDVSAYRRADGTKIDRLEFRAETYQLVLTQDEPIGLLNWLRIEVAPYWPSETMYLQWYADDRQLDAAMFGVAASWGYLESAEKPV